MSFFRICTSALCVALLITALGSSALGATITQTSLLQPVLVEEDTTIQGQLFYNALQPKLAFSTVSSYLGKQGKWMGFVDIYEAYPDEPGGATTYSLQQATVQYGMSQLPTDTKAVALTIGDQLHKLPYTPKLSVFSFTPMDIPGYTPGSAISMQVQSESETVDIAMSKDFPSASIPTQKQVIELMAPAYVAFADKKQPDEVEIAYLKLRSYLKNINTMQRSFTWELYLLHEDTLPCNATILRYDCDTKKSSVTQRTIREF